MSWLEGVTYWEPEDRRLALTQEHCRMRLFEARQWLAATTSESPDADYALENFLNAVAVNEEWGCIGHMGASA